MSLALRMDGQGEESRRHRRRGNSESKMRRWDCAWRSHQEHSLAGRRIPVWRGGGKGQINSMYEAVGKVSAV